MSSHQRAIRRPAPTTRSPLVSALALAAVFVLAAWIATAAPWLAGEHRRGNVGVCTRCVMGDETHVHSATENTGAASKTSGEPSGVGSRDTNDKPKPTPRRPEPPCGLCEQIILASLAGPVPIGLLIEPQAATSSDAPVIESSRPVGVLLPDDVRARPPPALHRA